ncbi:MAG: UvrD-helicase domain-containing protein [Fusobacteriaceae bacterium]
MEIIYKNINPLNEDEDNLLQKIKFQYEKIDGSILYVKPMIKDISVDFLFIHPTKGVFILSIVSWKYESITYINNMVGELADLGIKNPFFSAKQSYNFIRSSFEANNSLINEKCELNFRFYIITIFPNIEKNDILKIPNSFTNKNHFVVSSKEFSNLFLEKICSLDSNEDSILIDEKIIRIIRYTLFPELRLPQEQIEPEISEIDMVNHMIKVLDYEQEKLAHTMSEGLHVIKGVPGSGKTVILMARAIYLAKIYPNSKIKILTFTKTLKSIIKNRFSFLKIALNFQGISLENISVDTFHTLAMEIVRPLENQINIATENIFWKETLPKAAFEKAQETYDYILIDEYQDFHSNWIDVCLKLLKPRLDGQKNLFLTGDPMQSIYDTPKYDLKKFQGYEENHTVLKNSYRTGKKQMEIAINFLGRDPNFQLEIKESYRDLKDVKTQNIHNSGIIFLENGYREVRELLEHLIFQENYSPKDIIILAPNKSKCEGFYVFLSQELQEKIILSKNIQDNKIILTTYHSAKGIEARICILLNFDHIEDKKLAYVAITRASEQIYIHAENIGIQNFASDIYKLSEEGVNT